MLGASIVPSQEYWPYSQTHEFIVSLYGNEVEQDDGTFFRKRKEMKAEMCYYARTVGRKTLEIAMAKRLLVNEQRQLLGCEGCHRNGRKTRLDPRGKYRQRVTRDDNDKEFHVYQFKCKDCKQVSGERMVIRLYFTFEVGDQLPTMIAVSGNDYAFYIERNVELRPGVLNVVRPDPPNTTGTARLTCPPETSTTAFVESVEADLPTVEVFTPATATDSSALVEPVKPSTTAKYAALATSH
jgi:hypothetical protein